MKRRYVFLFVLLFLGLFSCNKSDLTKDKVIQDYASKLNGDAAELFKIRAAFAKTVASAMEDDEFRHYFKSNFCVLQEDLNHYKELLFARHFDDVVKADGATLRQLLEQHMDEEVRELFGDGLIEQVLDKDPAVVLKLPDLFRTFEWNPDKTIPMVVPMTPSSHLTFGEEVRFVAYFYNGRHDLVYNPMQSYFYCALRYSEDYFLMDKNTLTNEKGISFYEILPQAQEAPNGMRDEILAGSIELPLLASGDIVAVNKMEVFKQWRQLYSYQKPSLYYSTNCQNTNCVRSCIPESESVLVLDTFLVRLSRILEYQQNFYLDDAQTYTFVCWSNTDEGFLKQINIPSLPHEYFEARSVQISLKEKDKCKPPRISFSREELGKGKAFMVNAFIKNMTNSFERVQFRSEMLVYSDAVEPCNLTHPVIPSFITVNSSICYPEQLDFVAYCDPPGRRSTSQSWFSVRY